MIRYTTVLWIPFSSTRMAFYQDITMKCWNRHSFLFINMRVITINVVPWWKKYFSNRSLIKHICSWSDKLYKLFGNLASGLYLFHGLCELICYKKARAFQIPDTCWVYLTNDSTKVMGSWALEVEGPAFPVFI